jgi:DNA gyrase subunit B
MTGRSALEVVLTALHSGATFDGHHPHVHLQSSLQGVGLAVVNALSARFEVESRRSGVAYRAAFEAGRMIEPLTRVGETSMKGTRIRFLRDDEIFDEGSTLDLTKVEARLTELSWLSGALNVRFQDKHLPHAGGLAGWVRRLAPDVITETLLEIADSARRVDVALTLAWSPSGNGPRVMSFVNYHPTIDGGSHAEGVLSAVTAAASARSPSSDRLLAGLVAIVHVGLLDPDFGGPNTTSLHVEDVRLAVHEVVTRAINNAPWWWDKLHEVIG